MQAFKFKVGNISLKFSSLILAVFVLFFLTSLSVSATTKIYCPPLDGASYKTLVDSWYAASGIKDFVLSGFSFCGNESEDVSGTVTLSSENLSKLGLRYVLTLSVTANKNTDTLKCNPEIDTPKITKLVKQFESKKEVRDFVKRFLGTLEKDVFLFSFRVKSGDYFLEYDDVKDEFTRYSLPILMSDDFPPLADYKKKVEAAGCSINTQNSIFYMKDEYWNKITLYSVVDGNCKRSDTYTPSVFEVEYPIRTDIWTRIKIWFKELWH